MWDMLTACNRVLDHFISERNKAPRCVVCDAVLYDYQTDIYNYLYMLEVKHRKTHVEMNNDILNYVFEHYPYQNDKSLARHHVNYAKNIQVPTCDGCHARIHNSNDPELKKWLPVDKRPKDQVGFESNMYKPLD